MKYRAVLNDAGATNQERPVQIMGNHKGEIDRWAALVLATAVSKGASVTVYETIEQQCGLILKKQEPTA
jgi:hypothetical protein